LPGSAEVILRTGALTKVYPDGTRALNGVDFDVVRGEVHGLLGENGAGKTTLSKILSGILRPTSGKIFIKGKSVDIKRPREALDLGIGMVHQHFTLVRNFSAFENILLGTPVNPRGSGANAAREQIVNLSKGVGLGVVLDAKVEDLALGAQQRIEILKMLYRNVDVLILDEPTSSLTATETAELFKAIRKLKEEGKSAIFITHKLGEVLEICDRITVLRRGEVTGMTDSESADRKTLARMMVGRDVVFELTKDPPKMGAPILEVSNLTVKGNRGEDAVKGVTFTVRRGEIFGIAGVEGNGQTELEEALSGIRRTSGGAIKLKGVEVGSATTGQIRRQGVGLIPEDRRVMGLVLDMNVSENTILGKQWDRKFRGRGIAIAWLKVKAYTSDLIKKFEILVQSPESPAKSMSGGNQQKVVVSREIADDPEFILAAQPTRGLDVAASEYIRRLLLKTRDSGKGVLLISADLDEVLQLSDEIGVMYEGRLIEVGPSEKMGRHKVGMLMGGVKE
jgi:simple sugar transport system ATP-binding protein